MNYLLLETFSLTVFYMRIFNLFLRIFLRRWCV